MTKARKDAAMQMATNSIPPLPIPRREEKRLMQAEVNQDLFTAVQKEMEKKGLKIREIMEWGLRAFLLTSNPKEAHKLGIKADLP